ncbi:LacI family DNA-binding transcriptional regulator [Paenibacillaceae bacterium WGS1546]|uniref:LacI family DNA-binding transcriptional regulator n=1 Tax=Cohnella sp. WGS1546 TaxID=3366810 RepID=UPI00372D3216
MKKPTLRDVAREAGVSVATASYVLNSVSNQTIPEDTKKRVYEAAAHLKYVKNLTAKSLSIGKTNLLGILLIGNDQDLISKRISYGTFIDQLEQLILAYGYHLFVARIDPARPNFNIIQERKLDGVFIVDASEDSFHQISGQFPYGSPVVLVDSIIDDPLFQQVVPDYGQLFPLIDGMCGDRSYAILHERWHNDSIAARIRDISGVPEDRILAATRQDDAIRSFVERHRGRPLIVFNEFLALHAAKYANSADMIVVCTSGCPDYLPAAARQVRLETDKAAVAATLMITILTKPYSFDQLDSKIEFRTGAK